MEQTNNPKPAAPARPVMDVTPPKNPAPAETTPPTPAATVPQETSQPATKSEPVAPKPEHGPLTVHKAPDDPDAKPADGASREKDQKDEPKPEEPEKHEKPTVPKTAHTPGGIVALTIVVMLILSGLTVLVYLNS